MNKIALILILSYTFSSLLPAQSYIFFDDSQQSDYYDPSWGFFNNPSYLQLINQNKFPVSTKHVFSGLNSLKMSWISRPAGDWAIAVASEGWISHDLAQVDSIVFMAYSEDNIDAADYPKIFLEDVNNVKTPAVNLSDYNGNLLSGVWRKFVVPLDVFKSNPGSADLTRIKTIFFGQNNTDEMNHILYLDNIKMINASSVDLNPPETPENFSATGFDMHVELSWDKNTEPDLNQYYIYKIDGGQQNIIGTVTKDMNYYSHYLGSYNLTITYKISAVDSSGNESPLSEPVTATTHKMNDADLLTMVERSTFRYFWDYAHPESGLIREGYLSHPGNITTTGGTGFGLMAILVGIERGFISRQEGIDRYIKVLQFLINKTQRYHGAFSHWIDGKTGETIPFSSKDDGGDLVETAYLMQALLTARNYFDSTSPGETQIRSMINQLWEGVEWDWYMRSPSSNYLYWHWSPNYNWDMNVRIVGWNEALITYILAIASPTHHVPRKLYESGWAGNSSYTNGKTFYGYPLFVGQDYGGPLFFAHYSFLGFDPRDKKDKYANYFINNKNHTLINRAYCIDNPKGFAGYNDSTWGLTAGLDPGGYSVHAPWSSDNGTISPTAAVSSIVYTPLESMAVIRNLYRNYGEHLWGVFGFKDAFNPSQNWYSDSYLAIDQGPVLIMIENYRSQLLWNNFMANPEISAALDSIGFVPDVTSIKDTIKNDFRLKLTNYPNPFGNTSNVYNPTTVIQYNIASGNTERIQHTVLKIYDVLGREVSTLVNEFKQPGEYSVIFDGRNLSSGVYFIKLRVAEKELIKKIVYLR